MDGMRYYFHQDFLLEDGTVNREFLEDARQQMERMEVPKPYRIGASRETLAVLFDAGIVDEKGELIDG